MKIDALACRSPRLLRRAFRKRFQPMHMTSLRAVVMVALFAGADFAAAALIEVMP